MKLIQGSEFKLLKFDPKIQIEYFKLLGKKIINLISFALIEEEISQIYSFKCNKNSNFNIKLVV